MRFRVVRFLAMVFVLCGVIASSPQNPVVAQGDGQDAGLPAEAQPPAHPNSQPPPDPYGNQDGMLPSELDPDDDDDGVQDSDDSHPNDPTKGEKPPAGPTDSIADDDGDGLPNVMDPDDNNNGIPDATDGVGIVDPAPGVPAPTSRTPATQAPSGSIRSTRQGNTPRVRSLPVTGAGLGQSDPVVPVLLIGTVLLLATGHWTKRRSKR